MNLLYMDWNSFCRKDVLEAFKNLGHNCTLYQLPEAAKLLGFDKDTIEQLHDTVTSASYDFVFSMNYFPMISEACYTANIPYLSWIYDNPYMKGYSINIVNPCNFIFTFDSSMYEELRSQGVQTVYYAPMAANPLRISKGTPILTGQYEDYKHDISFVGALYDEDHNFYEEFVENAKKAGKDYYIGFIDALIETQLHLYGTNVLATALPKEIVNSGFASINEWNETNGYFTTPEAIFADNVLCRKITSLERKELLEKLSQQFSVALYTRNARTQVGNCQNLGYINYYRDMPQVFQQSKINLNISLKSIKTGIPLRAIEIMGAGGFLLSNYQSDFLLHFEPDVDFVYYENIQDAVEKAAYYLKHDEERAKIARNGLNKIKTFHSYEQRLSEMLQLVFS